MKRVAVSTTAVLAVLGVLTGPAAGSPGPYADRLAANAAKAQVDNGCLVLRSIDLCGWRVRLARDATNIAAEVGCANRRSCWYEWTGETTTTRFFCRGYMAYYPRPKRWMADQSLDCYADDDPSWHFTDDGVLIREP